MLFQLHLEVGQLAFGIHQIVFVGSTLGGQLGNVSLRHLAHFHHGLSALLVLLAGFQTLTVHLDGLRLIQYLDVQLGNAFLNGVGSFLDSQGCFLLADAVQFHLVVVLVAVPHGPLGIHTIGTIVIGLLRLGVYLSVSNGD